MKEPLWKTPPRVNLRRGKKPQKHEGLAGVIIIETPTSVGHSFIRFDEEDVLKIAKKMPQGIGPAHTAYIHVVHTATSWNIYCRYFLPAKSYFLWKQDEKPHWIGKIYY